MLQDFRYAGRMIRQHPWFSAAIIGTMALGIGVNTTVFTLVHAVLLKPLPFPGGERLTIAMAVQKPRIDNRRGVSYPDFRDFREQSSSFERLEALYNYPVNVSEKGNPPDRYRAARITPGLFPMLQVQPVLGRTFQAPDGVAGAEDVMLISYGVWKDRYGKDPAVIGRTVRANEKPAVIVGVLPEGMHFPNHEDIWTNATPTPELERRDNRAFMLVGMRKPGVSIAAAQADMERISRQLEQQYPESHKDYTMTVLTFHDAMNGGPIRRVFLLMMGAVGLVLLIACANVANMLLGRAVARRREISIRVALGAGRMRIVRQLLLEGLLLAGLGGSIGLALSVGAVDAFSKAVQNVGKPYWIIFELDYVVAGYCAAVCLFSSLLFGLAPALQATRVDLNESLKEGAKSSGGVSTGYLSGALVVVQFTLAVVLLIAAGLMIRSFVAAEQEFADMQGDQILQADINLPEERYKTADERRRFFEQLLARLAALPGVRQASMTSAIPGSGTGTERFEIAGQPVPEHEQRLISNTVLVAPGYFQTLGMPLVRGRDFNTSDGLTGKGAVLVSREWAERHFPKGDPIGQQIRFFDNKKQPKEWMTIVGITPNIRQSVPGRPDSGGPVITVPYNWYGSHGMSLVLRAAGSATEMAGTLRREVQQMDGDLPLFDVASLQTNMVRNRWHLRVFGTLFFSFALIALGMAAVGIYAVLAHATGQRTREIGVRLALGAGAGTIVRMILRRGLVQIGIGMTIGLTAAYFVCRLMASLLIKVSPTDPVTFWAVGLTLFGAGLAACLIPARRASRLDPLEALRHE